MKIDFVSDIACPWCAVGLASLQTALARLPADLPVELHFQPFELDPSMPREGRDIHELLAQKYGMTPEQVSASQENIRQRGAAVGFEFRMDRRTRSYNTFDAHRLLHWAGLEGHQVALKRALLKAYFTDGGDPSDPELLARVAGEVGLDAERARRILAGDEFAAEVRQREKFYLDAGIHSVPAVIIDERHLISGGQPPDVFEQALRQIAAASAANGGAT